MAKGYKGNNPADSTYVEEIKNFLDSIMKKSQVRHTFDDELKILKVLDAIEKVMKNLKKLSCQLKEKSRIYKGIKKYTSEHGNRT